MLRSMVASRPSPSVRLDVLRAVPDVGRVRLGQRKKTCFCPAGDAAETEGEAAVALASPIGAGSTVLIVIPPPSRVEDEAWLH